jgi:PST family polysaccharide transporter
LTVSVARRAASGVAWNIFAGVAVRVVGLVGTLFLTRYIAPAEYGEVSAAVVCVVTMTSLFTFGLGPYVIARRTGPEETFQVHVTHMMAIGIGCLGVVLLREPLGAAVGAVGIIRFLPGLALATFLAQTSHIPSATLIRSLNFRVVALSRAGGEIVFTAVSVALVPLIGALAIVAGNLARSVVTSSLLIARSNKAEWLRPTPPRWQTARAALAFGIPLTAGGLANTFATSVDNLLISRLFGPKVMGQYNLAYNLASTPTGQMADYIGDTLLPSFARMDHDQRRRALPRAAGLMALTIYPLAAGLAAVAPTLVPTLLDPRWAEIGPMLQILSGLAIASPITWIVSAVLANEGRTTAIMWLFVLKAVAVLGLILAAGRMTPLWACGAVILGFTIYGAAYLAVGRRLAGLQVRAVVWATFAPLVASLLMFGVVAAVRSAAVGAGLRPGVPLLTLEVATGAISYLGLAFVLARSTLLEMISLAAGVVRSKTRS